MTLQTAPKIDFSHFIETLEDAIAIFDVNQAIVYCNEAFSEEFYLNFGMMPVIGINILQFLPNHIQEKWLQYYQRAFIGEIFRTRIDISETDLVKFYLIKFTPWYVDGTINGVVLFARNVSEFKIATTILKDSNELLAKRNTRLEEFSYMMAHNIKSPISNIVALLRLYGGADGEAERKEMHSMLNLSVKKLNHVVDELSEVLNFGQNQDVILTKISLDEVYKETIEIFNALILEHKVSIKSHFSISEIDYILKYIYSIFLNLVSNSIKYRNPQKQLEIKISSYKLGKKIVLEFQDNGLGMDIEKVKNEIFMPYKTFHNFPESKGLGLFLVRSQVEIMGGSIQVKSKQDEGTVFTVVL